MHRISIVPRGRALGYTLNLPEEDRYLKTREELVDYMTVLLGGRAAEHLVFGADHHRRRRRPQAGGRDRRGDGQRVRDGHGADLAAAHRRHAHEFASEATRRLRDQEQQALAEEAQRAAYALLSTHRALLDELAATLLRDEVLERDDIERIVGDTPRAQRPSGAHLRVAATQPPPPEPPRA